MKFWKWTHKWFSVSFGALILLWAVSGILLNHRRLISSVDIDRSFLPKAYRYENWNNAAVRSGLQLGSDSLLLYGNIGLWLTDTLFQTYQPFYEGFPNGTDNYKTNKVFAGKDGTLYAATQSGLYVRKTTADKWKKVPLDLHDERIIDITSRGDRLVFLTRSELIFGFDNGDSSSFYRFNLPRAVDDAGHISLFKTLWVLHSGEIFGTMGKLLIDFFALTLIFLVITGFVYFFFPQLIKRRKAKLKANKNLKESLKFSIRWHQKAGIWIGLFLIFTTLTGMFLRPPLLIAISTTSVAKIPFSTLSHPNPWHDQLRAIHWNEDEGYWLIGTNKGFYKAKEDFSGLLIPFAIQPPVSVMGINTFTYLGNDTYLVGSFNGLFWWQPNASYVRDAVTGEVPAENSNAGSPLGKHLIAGMVQVNNDRLIFDYNKGLLKENMMMPSSIQNCKMPLWNVALEMHTGRIFQDIVGPAYILIVPVFGLIVLIILIGGVFRWFKIKRINNFR